MCGILKPRLYGGFATEGFKKIMVKSVAKKNKIETTLMKGKATLEHKYEGSE